MKTKIKKPILSKNRIRNRREQKIKREERYNNMVRIESEDKRLIYNNCL